MTPDEARLLFFQHLPLVRNSSDLLRLTLRVLPHLSANPERPLGAIDTMVFRLQLEHAKSDDTIRVWYNSNRDVSAQLRTLEPLYTRGSSGPSFCSGLSHRMKLPNGPNVNGPGLPLGVFAKEHATAKKKLDAATSVEQWWTLFLGYTPLWLRTAYHWDKPTPEQKMVLKSAKKAMLGYAPEMIRRTRVSYDHRNGKTSTRFEPMFASYAFLKHAPHWNALGAGQKFFHVRDTQENTLSIEGLQSTMPGVHNTIRTLCQAMCMVYDWDEMSVAQVNSAVADAKERAKVEMELPVPAASFTL